MEKDDDVEQLSQLSVRDPEESKNKKPQDMYSIITRMNAQLQTEEDCKRRKDIKSRQQYYREQLDEQLKEKQREKARNDRENNIWYNTEKNQMDR